MGLGPNWYQIGNKIYFIPKVSKFYVGKGYLCQQASKCHHCQVNVYFTDKNIRSIKLEFLECKGELNQEIELKEQMKKMGLKCLRNGKNHVYFQTYGY